MRVVDKMIEYVVRYDEKTCRIPLAHLSIFCDGSDHVTLPSLKETVGKKIRPQHTQNSDQ